MITPIAPVQCLLLVEPRHSRLCVFSIFLIHEPIRTVMCIVQVFP